MRSAWILVPAGVVLVACAFLVSPGLFITDEAIQLAGASAVLGGGLSLDYGASAFASSDLQLRLLVDGPSGLTPQYPPGPAVLGAPLVAVFGLRGLMLLNTLAAAGTLAALWALAARHAGGPRAALAAVLMLAGATFWLDYAYAVWPHSVSVLCVTLALLFVLDGLEAERRFELKALAAGAAVGFGFLFRTDTVLAVPALGLIAVLFARRPFRMGVFFGLGLLPFVGLASAANEVKFGVLNPLSYGRSGSGGTSLAGHLAPIAALAAVSLLLVAARFTAWRPGRREYAAGVVAVGLVLLLSEPARDLAGRYLAGGWALLVDATAVPDPRHGVEPMPGGVLSFWGLWKKALGQSMPWLGLLLLAVHAPADGRLRRLQWAVLILAAVWSLPFFMFAWHGGMGSNMRYFLPLLPALCALSARLLVDLAGPLAQAPRILLVGALAGVAAIAGWTALHPTGAAGAQQILSTWLLAAVAAVALASGLRWRGQRAVRVLCLGAVGSGLAASAVFLAADFRQTQVIRAHNAATSAAAAGLPDHALVYAPATHVAGWAFQPGHVVAMPGRWDENRRWDPTFDQALIDQALTRGYRVFVWSGYADADLRRRYGARYGPSPDGPGGEFLEIRPPALPARAAGG